MSSNYPTRRGGPPRGRTLGDEAPMPDREPDRLGEMWGHFVEVNEFGIPGYKVKLVAKATVSERLERYDGTPYDQLNWYTLTYLGEDQVDPVRAQFSRLTDGDDIHWKGLPKVEFYKKTVMDPATGKPMRDPHTGEVVKEEEDTILKTINFKNPEVIWEDSGIAANATRTPQIEQRPAPAPRRPVAVSKPTPMRYVEEDVDDLDDLDEGL